MILNIFKFNIIIIENSLVNKLMHVYYYLNGGCCDGKYIILFIY